MVKVQDWWRHLAEWQRSVIILAIPILIYFWIMWLSGYAA